MTNLPMTPVLSKNVKAVGYDPAAGTMDIQFHSGAVYHYRNIPQNIYDGLMASKSKGAYLNSEVRTKGYPYRVERITGMKIAANTFKDLGGF